MADGEQGQAAVKNQVGITSGHISCTSILTSFNMKSIFSQS